MQSPERQEDPDWLKELLERPDYKWLRRWKEDRGYVRSTPSRRYSSEQRPCPHCGELTLIIRVVSPSGEEQRLTCRCQLSPGARQRAEATDLAAFAQRAREVEEAWALQQLQQSRESCKEAMLELGPRCFDGAQDRPECEGCELRRPGQNASRRTAYVPPLRPISMREVDI